MFRQFQELDVATMPSVLLYLSAEEYQLAIRQADKNLKPDRTLYPYFLKPEQEKLVAFYLKKQAKPMSIDEKNYFGFSEGTPFRSWLLASDFWLVCPAASSLQPIHGK